MRAHFLMILAVGACAHSIETSAAPEDAPLPSNALGIEYGPQIPLTSESEPQSKLDDYVIKRVIASNPLVEQVFTPEELRALEVAEEKLSQLTISYSGVGSLKEYLVGLGRSEEQIYITLIPRYRRNGIPYNEETAYRSGGDFSHFYGFGDYVSLRITISTTSWTVIATEELIM